MARQRTSKAEGRVPVTRERALRAAISLADAGGLESLTMRRLAQELGVEAMSLYHHVANKDDILDGMVDLVFAEITLPPPGVAWKAGMVVRASSLRDVLTSHPWAISIMESRTVAGPAIMRHHDAVLGACRAAGFSVVMAGHAFSLIDSYVYGFVLQEVNLPFDEQSDMDAMVKEILPGMLEGGFPHLAEMSAEVVLKPGYSYGNEFAFGLELILDGMERAAKSPDSTMG